MLSVEVLVDNYLHKHDQVPLEVGRPAAMEEPLVKRRHGVPADERPDEVRSLDLLGVRAEEWGLDVNVVEIDLCRQGSGKGAWSLVMKRQCATLRGREMRGERPEWECAQPRNASESWACECNTFP
jgi:hypothetical protein